MTSLLACLSWWAFELLMPAKNNQATQQPLTCYAMVAHLIKQLRHTAFDFLELS